MSIERLRLVAFFGVFVFLILAYVMIFISYKLGLTEITIIALGFIIGSAPIITGDISALGEYTPPLLAALMAATAPPKADVNAFIVAVVLSMVSYALYIHLTVFFSDQAGQTLIEITQQDPLNAQKTIDALITSVRTFSIVVAAGLVGIRLNKAT